MSVGYLLVGMLAVLTAVAVKAWRGGI